MERQYLCIDLKSFYASVECIERELDPLNTNLVVANIEHTEKTICLAVSPSLKSFGVGGRPRLFEVIQRVKEVNRERKWKSPNRQFSGKSYVYSELTNDPSLELDYIVAKPRMALYEKYSTRIYEVYLKYVSEEDILVYSIDEVFIDLTNYLNTYKMTAHQLAIKIIKDVVKTTGITATAGIGTNLYLSKIAMDIWAKKMAPDEDGVRLAELDEISYREKLWTHTPLTDFWMVGAGISKKLIANGMNCMGDIARKSSTQKGIDELFKIFGINAELIIDRAWGFENITIEQAKSYTPSTKSQSSGQVLTRPYTFDETRIIVREMTELLVLDIVKKKLLTSQVVVHIGYDIESLTRPEIASKYHGEVKYDPYGRAVPKHSQGTGNLEKPTSSTMLIMDEVLKVFDRVVNKDLLVRRVNITFNKLILEKDYVEKKEYKQLDLFSDYDEEVKKSERLKKQLEKEKKIQEATIELQERFGKNAILKGMNLQECATTMKRNKQIGGHNAE